MKLKFTKKLILESVKKNNNTTIIQLVSYLKEDFIENLIRINIENNTAKEIYFSSNNFGTSTWVMNKGIIESHRWETEDDLNETSFTSRYYPIALEDGIVTNEFALEKIIPDVLDNLIDLNLSLIIYKIINSPKITIECNWDDLINNYKIASNDFIDKIISKYKNETSENLKINEEDKIIEGSQDNIENNSKIDKINDSSNARKYLENAERISRKLKNIKIN